jgi:uracil-DNA glycosylase family 4
LWHHLKEESMDAPANMAANLAELLQWYADIGVDEAIGDTPIDRTVLAKARVPEKAAVLPMMPVPPAPNAAEPTPITGTIEALKEAIALAAAAKTVDELKAALDNFKGLSLKRTATQMVFADGPAAARVMVIGDAPGADEDRAGRPFAGVHGQLLDKMLGAIGLNREANAYITTILNWRTPGNRAPSQSEIDLSLPFIQRHIELVAPAVIVCVGGSAAKILLNTKDPISRLRGKWLEYKSIPVTTIFHPEFLIQSPSQKKVAWEDLQMIQGKLKEIGVL